MLQRAHVVQPVRKLHEDHSRVARHGQQHLAVVFDLTLGRRPELDPAELRHTVHDLGDLLSEATLDVSDRDIRVLDRVVNQPRDDRDRVESEPSQDRRHLHRVLDVLVP